MKIICVGRNYVEHIQELENAIPKNPVLFMKPSTTIIQEGSPFNLPDFSSNIQYECELVLKIGKNGKNIKEENALEYIEKIGLGIDFTARDLQNNLKEKGLPWEIAKAFDNSCYLGKFIPFDKNKNYTFKLYENNKIVQNGNSKLMLFSFSLVLSYISQFFTLEKGDYIFTGTPSGVAKVEKNTELKGELLGKQNFNLQVQ